MASINLTLSSQERRATKLFLYIFYIMYLLECMFNFNVLPSFGLSEGSGNHETLFGIQLLIVVGLLPISIYLTRKNRPEPIKYMYFITFNAMNLISEIIVYWGQPHKYYSGNILEVLLVLISPLFINKRYFYVVSIGAILKYIIIGIVIHAPQVAIPIALIVCFSVISFMILSRFQGFANAIRTAYDSQLEVTVKGIISAIELKDPYTRGHSERVAAYSLLLAQAMGQFNHDEIKSLNYACLLHDVGKVNIPDEILMKPSKLSVEEYEVIKTHPLIGASAISAIEGLDNCLEVIKYHHERWDGAGYPENLRGTDIPLLARVTSIADAFDAMTSTRLYRQALPPDEALRRIVEGKGTQFDPQLVETFREIFPSWLEVFNRTQKSLSCTM